MAETGSYWFARYKLKPAGRALVPLDWRGWAVIAGFVGGMVLGAALFLLFGLRDQAFFGILCLAVCAIASGSTFIWAGVSKSDPVRTVDDYRRVK